VKPSLGPGSIGLIHMYGEYRHKTAYWDICNE